MSRLLENKVCIITGAGKGIGYDCAHIFANHGASLSLISRTQSDLENLGNSLNLPSKQIFLYKGDASHESTVEDFVNQTIERFGCIDVLINNAGIRFRKPLLEISLAEWQMVMQMNTGSTFLFCREVGRHMTQRRSGKIINMASIVGSNGLADLCGYGASKGAIISLTKALAIEWAPYNVNVNVIAPGFCETSYAESFKQKSELYQFTLDRTPMKKWGKGEDVANGCLFLASDLSNYITGDILHIDGGWNAW